MDLRSAGERLAEALTGDHGQAERIAEVQTIVTGISARLVSAVHGGSAEIQEVRRRGEAKVRRAWSNLALQGVQGIEKQGSLAPGLSHQEAYVKSLREIVQESEAIDEFFSALNTLRNKWGSRVKYPLYAGGRRKQIDELEAAVRANLGSEEERVRRGVEESLRSELERAQAAAQENVHFGSVEFRGVLTEAFGWQRPEDQVIKLRWLILGTMTDNLFEYLGTILVEELSLSRDLLYFALERVMRSVYESFQDVVKKSEGGRTRMALAGSSNPALLDLAGLIDAEIQHARRAVAEFETRLSTQRLDGQTSAAIRTGLKSGTDPVHTDPERFAEICSGLRGDRTFEEFVLHLRRVKGLDPADREEVVAAVKTAVEPFRSLYYCQINYVRYLKGLKKFRESL